MTLRTPGDLRPVMGQAITDVETPAVIVDLDVMERNIRKYVSFANRNNVNLRSHVKTHKVPDIAHLQNDATDGGGIVCQTLGEAEVMAQCGIDDIYLSYMVVSEPKLDRLVWLSEKLDRFVTTVDGEGNVLPLQEAAARGGTTVNVVIELDVGLNRVGVGSERQAVELAGTIEAQPNLNLIGVMAFEGHISYDPAKDSESDFEERCLAVMDSVEETVGALRQAGHDPAEVKVGSTATSLYSGKHSVVTEINPGMYPFNDVHTVRSTPALSRDDCAVSVLSTVISKPTTDRSIVDAGSKSISLELDVQPVGAEELGLHYYNASEEHGWVDTSDVEGFVDVGDRLSFIPPHVCPTINLHDTLVGVRDGRVESVWEILARGKVK